MKKRNPNILMILSISIALSSCTSYKKVPYFRDLPEDKELVQTISNYTPLIIQENDVLQIRVSSLNAEASMLFNNPEGSSFQSLGNLPQQQQQQLSGFLVNRYGEVQLPYIGKVKVAGLSTPDATELISKKLEEHLKEPVVNLRIINFKIAVFGGVASPGIFPINSERITLVEALIMAGDLKVNSIRHNILIVREINGERKFARIDIGSKSTFDSEYFYLKNNDLIYVKPGIIDDQRSSVLSTIGTVSTLLSLFLFLVRL